MWWGGGAATGTPSPSWSPPRTGSRGSRGRPWAGGWWTGPTRPAAWPTSSCRPAAASTTAIYSQSVFIVVTGNISSISTN